MKAWSTLGEELAHRRVRPRRAHELELTCARAQERRLEALFIVLRPVDELGAEGRAVQLYRFVEVSHRHTDVVDALQVHQYLYQPSPVFRPSLPAFTFASSCADGRNRSSPVVLNMCSRALYVMSSPLKSPSLNGPNGQLSPFSTAISMSSNPATPASSSRYASWVAACRIRLTMNPSISLLIRTGVLPPSRASETARSTFSSEVAGPRTTSTRSMTSTG